MTVNSGVKSWKQRRSCRGMLHDDDDDDDDGTRRSRKNIHVSAFIRLSRGNARAAIKILRPRHYPLSKVQSVFSTGQAL